MAGILLTEQQAADLLGLAQTHLRYLRRTNQGPDFIRVGKRAIRYRVADVQAWIEENKS